MLIIFSIILNKILKKYDIIKNEIKNAILSFKCSLKINMVNELANIEYKNLESMKAKKYATILPSCLSPLVLYPIIPA